ncbi:MAG: precorrin-6y C5,15-methyltransferase (decarboxylating) subunit CbiE [Lachnospiraceae bacterium]|nr:precorrin-6y C5,15-methyltransferase (decarboxylating) subunit CbiE [Lachnospiraceae bacterium]
MKISLIGAGPGRENLISLEASKLIEEADILIGAERVLRTFGKDKVTFNIYKPDEIISKIRNTGIGKNVAVLFTGDPGFFSSAKKLFSLIDKDEDLKDTEINVIPGISSMQYFMENLHLTWENTVLTSLHGRNANITGYIRNNQKVFSLFGSGDEIRETVEKLHYYGMDHVRILIGENLSYPDENIILTDPKKFVSDNTKAGKLSVALFVNDRAEEFVTAGIEDDEFIRGDVPMTKSEVRTLSLMKLKLKKDSVFYDIGAGTGSVSVEAALRMTDGTVYAIEKKDAAIELIKENKRKFAADNIKIINGSAPDVFRELPKPDRVFIGGSSGRSKEIVEAVLDKNPDAVIVMNIVTMETLNEVSALIKEKGLKSDTVLVNITRIKKVEEHSMMTGLNPVYIVSFGG